jgi:hypothetical protein
VSSVASVINLLNPLMSFFGPSLQRAGDAGAHSSSALGKQDNKSSHHSHHHSAGGLSSNLRSISNLLLAGLSLAGLYDWLGASSLFTPTATTFARRKKPFDPGETFVDTPASLAAAASAKHLSAGAAGAGGPAGANSPIKQPPTPCPSVEEYISPTFARNYQGAWKYVVQIPHEGYFTQTIQRSSCVRQKCEFTEGVCHEAPRWVSLLVAEIYYPNAIFGTAQSASGQQPVGQSATERLALDTAGVQPSAALLNQLMATAPSSSQLQQVALGNGANTMMTAGNQQPHQFQAKSANGAQQDPLQMTDSLNTYNHNLNNAFLNAAAELGLDPMNVAQMQQLANAHNYQFLQRNGFVQPAIQQQQQQQPMTQTAPTASHIMQQVPAEPRSGLPDNNLATRQQPHERQMKVAAPAQSQQFSLDQAQQNQQVFSDDYIKALAIETIRRHPHLSIDELIKSLQMQQMRKKRDTSVAAGGSQQQQQHNSAQTMLPSQQYSQKLDSLTQANHNQQIRPDNLPTSQQNPSPLSLSSADSLSPINELGMVTHLQQQQQPQQPQSQPQQQQFGAAGPSTLTQLDTSGHHQYQQALRTQNHQANGNQQGNLLRSNQFNQQQSSHMLTSQSPLTHDMTAANQHSQPHQNQAQTDQQASPDLSSGAGGGQANAASNQIDSQTECDGRDKIGCYVVRVYYDWFLVNGSCKCWKTNGSGQQSGQSSGGSSSNGSGSFIRRIFTG